jgi:hypothetical protein
LEKCGNQKNNSINKMALSNTTTIGGGIQLSNAYHRISSIELQLNSDINPKLSDDGQSIEIKTEEKARFEVMVAIFKDKDYRDQTDEAPVDVSSKLYSIPISALNGLTTSDADSIKAKVYEHLKTLDEFSGATDV